MPDQTQIKKEKCQQVIEYFSPKGYENPDGSKTFVSADHILLGDVLEKLKLNAGQIHDTDEENQKILTLVKRWGSCEKQNTIISLSRSLQQILEGAEWETKCPYKNEDCPHCSTILLPPASELFAFLFSLMPQKS